MRSFTEEQLLHLFHVSLAFAVQVRGCISKAASWSWKISDAAPACQGGFGKAFYPGSENERNRQEGELCLSLGQFKRKENPAL